MKRYRVINADFDTRATILTMKIEETWEEDVKVLWKKNKEAIQRDLANMYGVVCIEDKIKNFIDIRNKPFSVVAFHNSFLAACRNAFICGAFYPALTGACALGERILNHMILALRDDYKSRQEYKKVYGKTSFDNWLLLIGTLSAWGVMLPEVEMKYREFYMIRNRAIHFNPETDHNDRYLALEAIHVLQEIIQLQFGALGRLPWFITDIVASRKVYTNNAT